MDPYINLQGGVKEIAKLHGPRGVQYAGFSAIIIMIRFLFSVWVSCAPFVSHTSGILYLWGHVSVCYICCAVRGQLWSTHRRAASLEAVTASTIFEDILLGRGMNGKEQSGEPTTYQTVAA